MSCVLRAWGVSFAVDEFLAASALKPITVFRRGERQSTKLEGPILEGSGFHAVASDAEFSDLEVQIADAVRFLEHNQRELARLVGFPGVDRISLDFGIDERDVVFQHERFPPNLLRIAGNLGIWLEFTLYPRQKAEA
jgi:hypothetical protein